MIVMGDIAWLLTIPAGLLIRSAPGDVGDVAMGGGRPAAERSFSMREVAAAPQFWLIALAHFACCAAHSGPIFHMVTHAIDQGIARMAAASVLALSGLASIAGRIGGGVLADRVGAKPTLVAGLALQSATIALYLATRDLASFAALGVAFGVAYGGVMPLYALLIRQYFGEAVMGAAYGAVFLVSTLGMGLGSFAGGLIYDQFGSYAWLFVSSFGMGGAAALIALTFHPPRAVAPAFAVAPSLR
jgi:MFS family permease